jgi:hypothetical protein
MGQNREERKGRNADLSPTEKEALSGTADRAVSPVPADLPEEFREEIRVALRYERGLAAKASVALAIVILVVLIRVLFLG